MKLIIGCLAIGITIAIFTVLSFSAKGPITGTESVVISHISMDQSGNCQAQYQVIFAGDQRYTRYGTVNFNTNATKQIVNDALTAAQTQEGL